MENIYNYFYIFAGCGLGNALFRYAVLENTPGKKKGIFDYVVKKGTLINIALVSCGAVVAVTMPHPDIFHIASALLPIMMLGIIVQYLCDSCSLTFRALLLNRQYAAFSVVTIVVTYLVKIIGSITMGLPGASLSGPIGYLIIFAIMKGYISSKVFPDINGIKPSNNQAREMLVYSAQYMITNGLWVLFTQNDMFLIGRLLEDSSAIAEYRVTCAVPSALSIVSTSIGIFVNPYFVRNEDNSSWVWKNYKRVLLATSGIIGLLSVLLFILAEPMLFLLYGSNYTSAAPLMRVLIISTFMNNAVRYTTANLLAAMGKVRINMIVAIAGMIGQIILDIIFISVYGTYGVGISSIIVYTLMAIGVTIPFVKMYRSK